MTPVEVAAERVELHKIIAIAKAAARRITDPKLAEDAKALEANARALLAQLPVPARKMKPTRGAIKRKAKRHLVRLDVGASIMSQVRSLGD